MHRDGNRSHRIASNLKRDLAQLIRTEYPRHVDKLLSITYIKVSPDLSVANVYCSCLDGVDIQPLVDELAVDCKQIRYQLAHSSPLKKYPALSFHPDNVQSSSRRIDSLLRSMKH